MCYYRFLVFNDFVCRYVSVCVYIYVCMYMYTDPDQGWPGKVFTWESDMRCTHSKGGAVSDLER